MDHVDVLIGNQACRCRFDPERMKDLAGITRGLPEPGN